ncbi:MAG TPA: hypothetical protein VK941_13075, partial [Gillisia sp.]|nr:hypothetical protein [Gillisia sp.]
MAKRDKNTTNENNDKITGNEVRKKKIDEKDLKMPNATGDNKVSGKGKEKTSSKSSKPKGTSKLPQREEPAFSEQNESSFSGSKTGEEFQGPTDSQSGKTGKKTRHTTAKEKEPSKLTQPAKGRFSEELESSGSALEGSGKKAFANKKGPKAKEKKPSKIMSSGNPGATEKATPGASGKAGKDGISPGKEKK